MRSSTPALVFLALVMLLSGCGHLLIPGVTRAYRPYVVSTQASRDELFAAAQRVAGDFPDAMTSVAHERYSVTIVTTHSEEMREWARITALEDGKVRVTVRTELRDGGRYWRHTPCVCEGYTYAREQIFAAAVLYEAGHAQAAVDAVSSMSGSTSR